MKTCDSNKRIAHRGHTGFTVVEFVVVLVLIGIVAMVTMSRMVRGSAMNAIVVRDQIVTLTRMAQQSALGRADVSLEIAPNPTATEVTLSHEDENGEVRSATLSLRGVSLSGDINETDSCGTTAGTDAITNAAVMTLNFDLLGGLAVSGITGNTGAVTSALRICINDDPGLSVCVSPSGFAYVGDCDV